MLVLVLVPVNPVHAKNGLGQLQILGAFDGIDTPVMAA